MEKILTKGMINDFKEYLILQEKSFNTVNKYIRDVNALYSFVNGKAMTKETVISYKKHLMANYKTRSVNSMLSGINSLLNYLGWQDLQVKIIKFQQPVYCSEDKELTREEYVRLCNTAEGQNNKQLSLILQTICATGIRVSELPFITVQSLKQGEAVVSLKGKTRTVFIVKALKNKLLNYCRKNKIYSGPVFVTSSGKSINRSKIWREMKSICHDAHVNPTKVYPHNLRHLFARSFYSIDNDISKLADILGHSSINTTRIYIISTGAEHRKQMENMNLVI